MLQTVQRTIRRHGLVRAGDRLLAGVSGGPDSMALLHALHRLSGRMGFRIEAAHLDHGLRGGEGRRDRDLVRSFCEDLGVDCHDASARVRARASRSGLSIEMAARQARHRFFSSLCRETGANGVALGHTCDDQAETLLLRLVRGAGRTGLGAMRPDARIGVLRLVRPLLDVTRGEALAYLSRHGIPHRIDATNASPAFTRNRIRHELLPLLRDRFNASAVRSLASTARLLRDEDDWMNALAGDLLDRCRNSGEPEALDRRALLREPAAARRRMILLWLRGQGVPADLPDSGGVERTMDLIRHGRGTATAPLGAGWSVERAYELLRVRYDPASRPPLEPRRLPVPGRVTLPEIGVVLSAEPSIGFAPDRPPGPGRYPCAAAVSAAKWGRRSIVARAWQPGDAFAPLGMTGRRKVQDIFTDGKVPRGERRRIPLLECEGEILWIAGYRPAADWRVASAGDPSVTFRCWVSS